MTDTSSEAWRHECECRDWLRRGYTRKADVDALIERITKIRGREAAEKLRAGMRQEYARLQEASQVAKTGLRPGKGGG